MWGKCIIQRVWYAGLVSFEELQVRALLEPILAIDYLCCQKGCGILSDLISRAIDKMNAFEFLLFLYFDVLKYYF